MTAPFDPLALLSTLSRFEVRFIIIGGFAGSIMGSPTLTNDLDICYDKSDENAREALVAALGSLDAFPREWPEGLPFTLDERLIRLGDSFTFATRFGNLDCLATPSGTRGYSDVAGNATTVDLGDGLEVLICSLDDLIRMKRSAGRPKDLIEVEVLAALADELKSSSGEL